MTRITTLLLVLLCLLGISQPLHAEEDKKPQPPLQLQNGGNLPAQQPQMHLEEDILDVRPPIEIPKKTNYLLISILAILGLLLLVFLILLLRKVLKKDPVIPAPGEVALAELQEAHPLRERGEALQYAQSLSDIVRRYIEAQFHIQFTRQTTREFLHKLASETGDSAQLLGPHRDMLQDCMEKCDMAKYAHSAMEDSGMKDMEDSVHRFISTTSSPENQQGTE